MAQKRCLEEVPVLREISPEHCTSCHFAEQLEGESFLSTARKAVD
jgi:hypothetical protein